MTMFALEDRTCPNCGQEWSALAFWAEDMHCHDCGRRDYDEALAAVNAAGRPYTVTEIGGACPMQVYGRWVDGRLFYFRARHGSWTLSTDDSDPVMGDLIASGNDPSNGWMEWGEALAVLDATAKDEPTPAHHERGDQRGEVL